MAVYVTNQWSIPQSTAEAVRNEFGRTASNQVTESSSAFDRQAAEMRILDLQGEILDMQAGQIDARYRDQQGLINEQQALLDLQRSQLDPAYADQQMVFAAQRALQMARSQEYQLRVRQLAEKRAELQQIQAAEDNVVNQAAVAAARRDSMLADKAYNLAGLAPIEIKRPLNGPTPNNLPPGVRYALETDAEQLGRVFERTGAARGLALEEAGLNTDRYGIRADDARMTQQERDAARQRDLARQGFNVDSSRLNMNRNDMTRGYDLDRRQLELDRARYDLQRGGLASVYGGSGRAPLAG